MLNLENVSYLEIHDLMPSGDLKPYVNNGFPAIIMAQGNFCGYCKTAKPAYQDLANSDIQVVLCTIQIDGSPEEKEAAKLLPKWDKSYRGVPAYFGFNKQGKYVKTHLGGRDTESIKRFANSL